VVWATFAFISALSLSGDLKTSGVLPVVSDSYLLPFYATTCERSSVKTRLANEQQSKTDKKVKELLKPRQRLTDPEIFDDS
jgi:hypothetical protein